LFAPSSFRLQPHNVQAKRPVRSVYGIFKSNGPTRQKIRAEETLLRGTDERGWRRTKRKMKRGKRKRERRKRKKDGAAQRPKLLSLPLRSPCPLADEFIDAEGLPSVRENGRGRAAVT